MNTMTDNYLTLDALAVIERAKALAPKLAARAQQADREGKISDETVQEMAEAGLFRVLQPKRWGGYEMDPRVFYSVQMELAKGCMSTAWIYGVVGVHPWQLALFPDQAQQDVWGKDHGVRIASTYMPTGKAEPVEGGFRFSGRWSFSTGSKHCDWLFLGGLLPKRDGTPGLEHVTFLVPKADYRIEDNWDVLGLRGTGSHDIVVENAFVPAHRIQYTNDHSDVGCPGRTENTSWLFRIPFICARSAFLIAPWPSMRITTPISKAPGPVAAPWTRWTSMPPSWAWRRWKPCAPALPAISCSVA